MSGANDNQASPFFAPDGAAEEFTASLEAATGQEQPLAWRDPMGGPEIKDALDRLLTAPRPDRGLDSLVRSGIMASVLPEVAAMVDFGEGIRHKDVWSHTKKVILRTPNRVEIRWAALLHDIGKVPTRRFEPDGQVTFIGHPITGARMFDKIARRIPLEKSSRERVRFLIASHLRASAYDETWTDSAVRRFTRDVGDGFEDLLDLSRADITSKYADKVRRGTHLINLLAQRVAELSAIDNKPAPLPKGLGTAIIERLKIRPGPTLGAMMHHLADQVEAGKLEVQGAYEQYLDYLECHRQLFEEPASSEE